MSVIEKCARCSAPLTNESIEAHEDKCIDCAISEAASRGVPYGLPRRDLSDNPADDNKRRHLRIPAALPATLIDSLGSQSVVVTEISAGGALIRGSRPPVADRELSLILVGAGTIHARLVHWNDRTGGLAFTEKPAQIAAQLILSSPIMGLSSPLR